ncbi:MAG: hypothetical protein GC131_01305 [Alphaproteobacteria bacterium]|nr:hypothetical protein [Alphaproteobacteria bacterium]
MRKLLTILVLLSLTGCIERLNEEYDRITEFFYPGQNIKPIEGEQPHQSWCYETIGEPDCYTGPQDVPKDRLINVDPVSQRPLTPEQYDAMMKPHPATPVQKAPLGTAKTP